MGSKSFSNKVIAIFHDRSVVDSALDELNAQGFHKNDISVLAKKLKHEDSGKIRTHSTATYPETETEYELHRERPYTNKTGLSSYPADSELETRQNYKTGSTYDKGIVNDVDQTGRPVRDDYALGTTQDVRKTTIRDDYPSDVHKGSGRYGNENNTQRVQPVNSTESLTRPDKKIENYDFYNEGQTTNRSYENTEVDNYSQETKSTGSKFHKDHDVMDKDPKAMSKGAATGGVVGLLAGLGALLIPGVGPVLATGPLAAAITAGAGGAAVGATIGGLIGLLEDEGIPRDRATFYESRLKNGDVIVIVHTEKKNLSLAREILAKYNPATLDSF